jgi:hypothetical protein
MVDADILLQAFAGTFLTAAVCMIGYCIRKTKKQPGMKSSPSMEELNGVVAEDPSS